MPCLSYLSETYSSITSQLSYLCVCGQDGELGWLTDLEGSGIGQGGLTTSLSLAS